MLKQRAIAAMLWSLVEQVGANGINTIFMLLFARLLTPTDFGVFASGLLIIGFGTRLAQLGQNTVVVQRSAMDDDVLSTAFWMTFVFAIFVAVLIVLMARPIASLFDDTTVAAILPYLTVGMLVSTATELMTGLLRRDLDMKTLAKRTLAANVVSGVIATPFALTGFGAAALVIQFVGGKVFALIFTVMAIGWRIRFSFERRVALDLLRFGLPVVGADLLTQYNRESPKLYVGVLLGTDALGIFSMAMRVMNLLINVVGTALSRVTLPVMSEVKRMTGTDRLREIYLRVVRLASAVILPIFLLCILLREPLVAVLLGPQWSSAAPVVGFLCGAGILTTLNFVNGSTLVAIGRPQSRFWFSALRAIVGTILLLLATPFGLVYAGFAFLLRGVVVEPVQLWYLLRQLGAKLDRYCFFLRGALVASAVLLVVGFATRAVLSGSPSVVILAGTGVSTLAAYVLVIYLFDNDLTGEIKGFAQLRKQV